tara:strand:+ start:34 stop:381 length:348 start_codon:yes stop_codon:yes gene_type:complete
MTNPKRGELQIVLGAKTLKGRVTLDVVMRIEDACGRGIVKIAQALQAGELTTSQMVAMLTPVIRAGGNDVDEKAVGAMLWESGLAEGMKAIAEVISAVLTSGGDEGNEEQAEALV